MAEYEVRELMDDNEIMSHIFLTCIPKDVLIEIRDKYIGEADWEKESVKIPVSLKIAGVDVNPKEIFKEWENQMDDMILRKAKELVAENLSEKVTDIQNKLYGFHEIFKEWEKEINWQSDNPLIKDDRLYTKREVLRIVAEYGAWIEPSYMTAGACGIEEIEKAVQDQINWDVKIKDR